MILNTVTNHFVAAVGVEKILHKLTDAHWQRFYYESLRECRRDIQDRRGRLLMASPMDYHAVRALDREMEEVAERLREIELEQSFK